MLVGALLANLQSHELQLRMFLAEADGDELEFPKAAGEVVEETYLTNWMHLRELIETYNEALGANEVQFKISGKAAEIRGALTHGRVLTDSPVPAPFSLYRFSKPRDGKVIVESITPITDEEVEKDIIFIGQEFYKVAACADQRGYFDSTKVGK